MAHQLRSRLAPPPADGEPRETMRWVRRMEIVSAVFAFVVAAIVSAPAGLRWALVALGLLALSPWGGANTILRKADKNPDVLIADPERRRERGRRVLWIMSAFEIVVLVAIGLVMGGASLALVMGVIGVFCALAGAWLFRRWARV
jgi:hypothetical protein